MSNQDLIDQELSGAIKEIRKRREVNNLFGEDSFPKPVMVYNNPNFKPITSETVLKKQKAIKNVHSPRFSTNPALFLNKESGSSFVDRQRRMFINPETGTRFGEPQPASTGFNRIHSAANFYPPAYVNEIPSRLSHIEKAKYVLRKNASENRALANHKEGSFNTRFKQFYESELKYDPRNIEAAAKFDMLQKSSTTSLNNPKRVSFVEDVPSSNHQHEKVKTKDQVQVHKLMNPKTLYKISSKPTMTRLIHQPHPTKREAFNQYHQSTSSAFKDRSMALDTPIQLSKPTLPTWNDLVSKNKGLEGVTSYFETSETRKLIRPMAEPADIDD